MSFFALFFFEFVESPSAVLFTHSVSSRKIGKLKYRIHNRKKKKKSAHLNKNVTDLFAQTNFAICLFARSN